ncbi:MAG TPA: 50S ribosomal protein L3 [Phycisphaerales bacterium]|nr:50S ribosomal protein L3 [Phycisphaerales bacterium]
MAVTLLGKKIGMTRVFSEDGKQSIPVTVLEVTPNVVTQVRTPERDGYSAVQVGWGEIKPRNSTIPLIGHDAKAGTAPKRAHGEFRLAEGEGSYQVGQELGVGAFEGVKFVDVIGQSKGKGFQGTMKRHNFKGMPASHGVERKHRSPGSIGAHATNRGHSGKLKKGKRMAGHMGDERVTVRSLSLVRIDAARNLLLVKGPVPGANGGTVQIRPAVRLNRSKGKAAAG